jgi:hypothetical protein
MTLRDSEVLADTVIGRPLTASAVPGLGQVRAATRKLPAGGRISAAASLEHDVPSAVHGVPPGERKVYGPGSWHAFTGTNPFLHPRISQGRSG